VIETRKLFSILWTDFAIWKYFEVHCFRSFALFCHWKDKSAETVRFQNLPKQWEQFPGLNHFVILNCKLHLSVRAEMLNRCLSPTLKECLGARGAPIGYGHFPIN